jgi:hypothetical protein
MRMSRDSLVGMTHGVTPTHESHQLTWRDSIDIAQHPSVWRDGHALAP